ncbi:DUF6221 family protein [Nocardia sp. NPDC057455]|uniref:DUF6221 family protein n=1 Tax=Nocardia sp. NPDC057455 TaxID=3346138 RepID=UPI0036725D60
MSANDALARLRAGLAEDERIARAAAGVTWVVDVPPAIHVSSHEIAEDRHALGRLGYVGTIERDADREHAARQSPKATLDRVEAIRKVIAEHADDEGYCTRCWDGDTVAPAAMPWPCPTVRALASIYAGGGCEHPAFALDDRSPIGDFEAFTYRCTFCEGMAIINRVAGDEPTEDEVRRAFRAEPTETGEPQ